ncbi:RNA polymerase sigma factor [uncultured Clostridium sp.]|uniref:RNA polymerase sigma factor n=1 Tax=uncultured Clostridium sp. TaxID=59620 RepID=UPI0025F87EB7|nr:RNA polymerase sigma factor [uncultured Clostridium sp.]
MGKSIGELVLLARLDDQNAINELYNQTFKKAYFVARTAIKSSDGDYSSQIEDILQDAYVKAFSSLDKLEDPEKFQGWLDTIVINRCKDFLKKKKPTLFSDMASENSNDGSTLDFEDSQENDRIEFKPEETVDYGETKRLIAEMLDRMPEDQKMCLLMYYYEEMSVRQIAEAMDCSEGTIKSRLNYARKNLKGQVLELEKKGTKLYCMPLLPFLYWFFREQAAEFIGGTAGTVAAGAAAGAGQSVSAGSTSSVAGQTASGSAAQAIAAGQAVSVGMSAGTAGAGTAAAGTAGTAVKTAAAVAGKASLGLGAKLAVAGVSAAVVIGGGAAVTGHLPISLPWVQEEVEETENEPETIGESETASLEEERTEGIDLSKFQLQENGMFPNEAYENDINRAAAAAYTEVLSTRPEFQKTADINFIYVYKLDINQDGVLELLVELEGEDSKGLGLEPYFLSYDGNVNIQKIPGSYASVDLILSPGLLPSEKKLILFDGGDVIHVQRFSMEDGELQLEKKSVVDFDYESEEPSMQTDKETEEEIRTLVEVDVIRNEEIKEPDALLYPSKKSEYPILMGIDQMENTGN